MIRVLYLITEMDVGGAERCVRELALRLDGRRFSTEVAWLSGEGPLAAGLDEAGVPAHPLRMAGKWDLTAVARLARLLRARRPDVLHTFLFHANFLGRVAAALTRVPVVISSARVAERRTRWHGWLDAWTSFLIDAEVAVSEAVRAFQQTAGVPARKLSVIPNGVDVSRFEHAAPALLRAELNIPAQVPLFLYMGRLDPQKGLSYLLRAFAQTKGIHLALAGDGPQRADLQRMAASPGLAGRVHFLGFQDDVPELLAAADVVVLPSLWEGMPNVLLEAAAARRPVIATDVEGVRDIVEDGVTGLIVSSGDATGLLDALNRMVRERGRWAEMGDAACRKVRLQYSMESVARRYEALYERHFGG